MIIFLKYLRIFFLLPVSFFSCGNALIPCSDQIDLSRKINLNLCEIPEKLVLLFGDNKESEEFYAQENAKKRRERYIFVFKTVLVIGALIGLSWLVFYYLKNKAPNKPDSEHQGGISFNQARRPDERPSQTCEKSGQQTIGEDRQQGHRNNNDGQQDFLYQNRDGANGNINWHNFDFSQEPGYDGSLDEAVFFDVFNREFVDDIQLQIERARNLGLESAAIQPVVNRFDPGHAPLLNLLSLQSQIEYARSIGLVPTN